MVDVDGMAGSLSASVFCFNSLCSSSAVEEGDVTVVLWPEGLEVGSFPCDSGVLHARPDRIITGGGKPAWDLGIGLRGIVRKPLARGL